MSEKKHYSIQDLKKDFSSEEKCLRFVFEARHTEECSCGGEYIPLFKTNRGGELVGRRQYQCSKCRFQIAPTAGTILHKSTTPLLLWFHALFVFSNAKSSISAKEIERQLGVTYKTAWRMLTLIREALTQDDDKLDGDVEMDSSHFGGRFRAGKGNKRQKEAIAAKTTVMAAVTRGGTAKAFVVPNLKAETHGAFLDMFVEPEGTRLMTDKSRVYKKVARGFDRHAVDHHIRQYVRKGDIHINSIESFFSHVKRSLKGTHKVISREYLQSYVDAFVWHYNNRHNDRERFGALLGKILRA